MLEMECGRFQTGDLLENRCQRAADVGLGATAGQDRPFTNALLDIEPVLLEIEAERRDGQAAVAQLAQESMAQDGVPDGVRHRQQMFRRQSAGAEGHMYVDSVRGTSKRRSGQKPASRRL